MYKYRYHLTVSHFVIHIGTVVGGCSSMDMYTSRWIRHPKRSTVVWCGTVMVAGSLVFSVLLLGVLTSTEVPDTYGTVPSKATRRAKLIQIDRGNRNILDIHVRSGFVVDDVRGMGDLERRNDTGGVMAAVDISPSSLSLSQSSNANANIVSDCKGPWPGYPQCNDKMMWMQDHWESNGCYAKHGVNGTPCSMQIYLSEVELFCPLLPEREKYTTSSQVGPPNLQYEVDGLLEKLHNNRKFEWISNRVRRLWPEWSKALKALNAQQPFSHHSADVLVHIGALSDKAGFHFAENAGKGGPLGELVQWSDLIASLYALGYNIDFSTEIAQLKDYLVVNNNGGCPSASEMKYVAVFVDIVGLKQLKKLTRNRFQMYKCLLRVLDTFGTEPVFNYKKWKPERDTSTHDYGHTWGNWELNPRQFMTMYPHTPDNSFLGFVVESHESSSSPPLPVHTLKSLVYGKELYMWIKKTEYLNVIAKYFDVYATIGTTSPKGGKLDWSVVPTFVHNQGILGGDQLQQLLQQSRIFVGLGFPYEGPAPLEAIAQGCVFLNPKVSPPIDRSNSKFFEKKPTNRQIDSQNPYMAMFVGEPYVYTIDANNLSEVESTIQRILKQPRPPPYIPYEFTFAGMLERVTSYLKNQQYCHRHQWPPADMLIASIGKLGKSCKDTCYDEGMVCEPELFPLLNTEEALNSNGLKCQSVKYEHSVHGPSLVASNSHCSLQVDNLLLSCAGSQKGVHRLCPCREYRKGQVALCLTCTR